MAGKAWLAWAEADVLRNNRSLDGLRLCRHATSTRSAQLGPRVACASIPARWARALAGTLGLERVPRSHPLFFIFLFFVNDTDD